MNRWDISGRVGQLFAGPLARIGQATGGADEIIADLDVKISSRSDATHTNMLRAYVWLMIMGVLVVTSIAAMIAGGASGAWIIQVIGGIVGLAGLFCGAISLPHLYRMFVSSLIFPESGKGRQDPKILRRVTPKPRDSWLGIACAFVIVGLFCMSGAWAWITAR